MILKHVENYALFGRTKWTQNQHREDQNRFQGPGPTKSGITELFGPPAMLGALTSPVKGAFSVGIVTLLHFLSKLSKNIIPQCICAMRDPIEGRKATSRLNESAGPSRGASTP